MLSEHLLLTLGIFMFACAVGHGEAHILSRLGDSNVF